MSRTTYTVPIWFTDYMTNDYDPRDSTPKEKQSADQFIATLPSNSRVYERNCPYWARSNDVTRHADWVVRIKVET